MAAFVMIPSKEQWEVIAEMLSILEQGGIIVTPDCQEEIKRKFNVTEEQLDDFPVEPLDYDYGGEADYLIDVMKSLDHCAAECVLKVLGIEYDPNVDSSML